MNPLDRNNLAPRRIAAGGMADLFVGPGRAARGEPDVVVIKRLFPHFAALRAPAAMFRHESYLLERLEHPGIPRGFGLEPTHDTLALRLAWIDGVPLTRLVDGAVPLGPDAALAIAIDLLDALEHVHTLRDAALGALDVVHRDVAPSNVLVGRSGRVHLVDFGVARSRALPADAAGDAPGTPGYVAPESVRGEPVDARADLFAVAVILTEMVTERRLFPGGRLAAMSAVAEVCIDERGPELRGMPTPLRAVLARALASAPEDRFENTRALAAALRVSMSPADLSKGRSTLARAVDNIDASTEPR